MVNIARQKQELASFQGLWNGGYFEGDPLDPHGKSSFSDFDRQNGFVDQSQVSRPGHEDAVELGFLSCLYAAYLLCIKYNVTPDTTVLEIGPGRGAWSKAILKHNPKQYYALDALSAEHNGFWEYVGQRSNASYYQVDDFSCSAIADNSIDFFFSFGVFCHISREGTAEYFRNIYNKMKSGSQGFVLISDYEKLYAALGKPIPDGLDNEPKEPLPGRWYHLGTRWFRQTLEDIGFTVIDQDIGVNLRDPIVKFAK